jgi:hypothetical protein
MIDIIIMPNIALFIGRKRLIIRVEFNKKKVINPIPSKSFAIHLNKKKVDVDL